MFASSFFSSAAARASTAMPRSAAASAGGGGVVVVVVVATAAAAAAVARAEEGMGSGSWSVCSALATAARAFSRAPWLCVAIAALIAARAPVTELPSLAAADGGGATFPAAGCRTK